jgi:hypothetical protein
LLGFFVRADSSRNDRVYAATLALSESRLEVEVILVRVLHFSSKRRHFDRLIRDCGRIDEPSNESQLVRFEFRPIFMASVQNDRGQFATPNDAERDGRLAWG